jgi:type IV pilus assembly protein PilC
MTAANPTTFLYEALAPDGQSLSGTIDAADAQFAQARLESLGLKLTRIISADKPRLRALNTDDFLAFNQELASLAQAGLPVEQGLRLIAQDLRTGRLATAVRELADDLEKGTPLAEAFDKHRGRFPALYGRLIDAGVKSSNLSGVLLNLNQHVQTMQRLRRAMWNAFAYPIALAVVMILVVSFLGLKVLPQFEDIFRDFHASLPGITQLLIDVTNIMPQIVIGIAVFLVVLIAVTVILHITGGIRFVVDYVLLYLPVIGTAIRKNLIARWCSAMRLGIDAGLDLPAAMDLAAQTVDSPRLQNDTKILTDAIAAGQRLNTVKTSLLPPILPAAIELGASRGDLAGTLAALSQMNQRQAELRISAIPVTVIPMLLIIFGFLVFCIVLALFMPMIQLIQSMSGGGTH